MRKYCKYLFCLLLIVICFTKIDEVKAETIKDKGYVVCEYDFKNTIKGTGVTDSPFTPNSCKLKIAIANDKSKAKVLECSDSRLNPNDGSKHTVTLNDDSVSSFHKIGTTSYTCPSDLVFILNSAKKGAAGDVDIATSGYVGSSWTYSYILDVSVVSAENYKGEAGRYSGKSVTTGNKGTEIIKYDGKDVGYGCHWDVTKLLDAKSNPKLDDEKYITCSSNNTELSSAITKWYKNEKDKLYKAGIENVDFTCSKIFEDDDVKNLISSIFWLISIGGVIMLLFTMGMDFVKVITSNEESMSEALKKSKNRIIATIILLILPILVNFVINVINTNFVQVTIKDKDGNALNSSYKVGNVSDCGLIKK